MTAAGTISIALITGVLVAAPAIAAEGPPPPATSESATSDPMLVLDEELAWNIDMQNWGHGLLGGGVALIIAGTILIEADGQGGVGKAGFSTIGGGLGVMTVGMFLLGFSRPVHLREPMARLSPTPVAWGQGAVLTYDRHF